MSRIRPAEVRYYIDADMLGLGHVLARLRPDITYPGDPGAVIHRRHRPPCPVVDRATRDDVWIPEVTRQGWLIVTRDRRIRDHPGELAAVQDHGARMIVLVGDDTKGTFAQLEVVMCRWRDIERKRDEPGPFIYAATRTRLTPVTLA